MLMQANLEKLFPGSVRFEKGVVCASTPFSGVFAIDYYDGAIEGFSKLIGIEDILYFKKIWWDDFQNNRLFQGFIRSGHELKEHDQNLFEFFEMQIISGKWAEPYSESEKLLVDQLIRFIVVPDKSACINIFCRDIRGELFILPMDDENR